MSRPAAQERWRTLEDTGELGGCGEEAGPFADTGIESSGGVRVLICRGCGVQFARLLKIGSRAAQAVLEETKAERAVLEPRLADQAFELDQLRQLANERLDRIHRHEFQWARVAEQSSALHALATGELG